jgi:hypothetical protein
MDDLLVASRNMMWQIEGGVGEKSLLSMPTPLRVPHPRQGAPVAGLSSLGYSLQHPSAETLFAQKLADWTSRLGLSAVTLLRVLPLCGLSSVSTFDDTDT